MQLICDRKQCTGCGMCSNVCQHHAIEMVEDDKGFVHPIINNNCIDCGLCVNKCPSNNKPNMNEAQNVFSSWTKDKKSRSKSSSGGIFTELAKSVILDNGVVVGSRWSKIFTPEHVVIKNINDLDELKGSKYAQSFTGNIYIQVKELLNKGIKILFSGTPCQVAALRKFLDRDYQNLITVDLVCHGVPSTKMLRQHYSEIHNSEVTNVCLRYKDPYWDYSYVKVDFIDGYKYQKLTLEDSYFNLFNIGYSLRESCHNCEYTNIDRVSDITLSDFWGYLPKNFKGHNYNYGTSCVIINTSKGKELFDSVKERVYCEQSTLDEAIKANKCLSEPFKIEQNLLIEFWNDYKIGTTLYELNKKYAYNYFVLPSHLWLRRIYYKFRWIFKR